MNPNILKRALISEKSFKDAANSKFTFIVDKKADKANIVEACENLFAVNVIGVNILNINGKVKRGKKGSGKRSDYKKAILTLKKGQKIDLFETEEEAKAAAKTNKKEKADKKEVVESKDTTVKVREKKK